VLPTLAEGMALSRGPQKPMALACRVITTPPVAASVIRDGIRGPFFRAPFPRRRKPWPIGIEQLFWRHRGLYAILMAAGGSPAGPEYRLGPLMAERLAGVLGRSAQ